MITQANSTNDHILIDGRELAFDSLVNQELLKPKSVKTLANQLATNTPCPHLVIDGLFSPVLLDLIYAEFDKTSWMDWREKISENETKRRSLPGSTFGHATELYFQTIYSSHFLGFLKKITGIEKLITDPDLVNGGLHDIPTGGFFNVHKDFTHHPVFGLKNRLVLITYLNKDWDESYGGNLELWNEDMTKCEAKVVPEFGRTIILLHSKISHHGLPQPVSAPNKRGRRSVAAYYYSPDEPGDQGEKALESYFLESKVDTSRVKYIIKQFVPPILITAGKKLKRSISMLKK